MDLSLYPGNRLVEGDIVEATGVLRDVRPFTPFALFIGTRVLASDAVAHVAWKWPWDLQVVTQKTVFQVGFEHNSDVLVMMTDSGLIFVLETLPALTVYREYGNTFVSHKYNICSFILMKYSNLQANIP